MTRRLNLQHVSGARLSIPIDDSLGGLADNIRDDFSQIHASSDLGLDQEASLHIKNLVYAALLLEYLVKQDEKSILSAARAHFDSVFLANTDLHSLASSLDLDQRKSVIQAYIHASYVLGGHSYGPRGLLWDSASNLNVYAVFGGQGNNEYYWTEMQILYQLYGSLITPLLKAAEDTLKQLAKQHSSSLFYSHSLLPYSWLAGTTETPLIPYLASCAVSLPLIGLTQLAQYAVIAQVQGLSPDQMATYLKGATGHSQGVVTAAIIAMGGRSWDDYVQNAVEGLRLLFYIGFRGTEAFPTAALAPALVAECVDAGEGTPSAMLAINGLQLSLLETKIKATNAHLSTANKGNISIQLFNTLRGFVVVGPPASLVGLVTTLRKIKAESGKDQSKIPFSKRLPVFQMRFLPINVPYHSPYLAGCSEKVLQQDLSKYEDWWQPSKLRMPVYDTEDGHDIATDSKPILKALCDQIFTSPIHWSKAIAFKPDATHCVDFGTGGHSGVYSMVAREKEGTGLRVVLGSLGTQVRGADEVYSSSTIKREDKWVDKYQPRLVKNKFDGKLQLDTPMSRLLSRPPLMVAGMTPCTVPAGFVAAVLNAGYHVELAGGGHYNAKALRSKVAAIEKQLKTPGTGLTLNALYINQRQFTFQLPLWMEMKREGGPVEGLCVAAGIPSTEKAKEIIDGLREVGIKHISFKPGSVEGIRQVVNIANSNPDFPVILQWTGGRAGGHHSCEDFHQPVLSTYASIRSCSNIILVGGSGFGGADDVWPYLDGSWSVAYGSQPMPYDGFLYASRVMVAKEAETSLAVKELIVKASGVDDGEWEGTYNKETGGILTVRSELGEPIHKVATRGIKLWKEFDDTVFALPREKRGAWLQEKREYVIKRLNADFQKPWFAARPDGTPCDLGDLTYAETVQRMVRLMYVAHQQRWIDISLRNLTGDWLRRTEERLSPVNAEATIESAIQSYEVLNDPLPFLGTFFEKYPTSKTQILSSEDIKYFLAICQRPGQKPCPFVAVLDNNFEVWFKKDSLWFAEDVDAVFDQDPQRVAILQGPVAVKYCTKVDEPIADLLGNIESALVKKVLETRYGGDESKIPIADYLSSTVTPLKQEVVLNRHAISYTTQQQNDGASVHVYEIKENLPDTQEWLSLLAGPKAAWLRAFLCQNTIVQGSKQVDNPSKQLFKPRKGQRIQLTVDVDGDPVGLEVFGSVRN